MKRSDISHAWSKTWKRILGAIGAIGVLLKIKWKEILEFIQTYPIVVLICLILMIIVCIFLYELRSGKNSDTLPEYSRWKHPVLVIDDDVVFLSEVEQYLSEKIDATKLDLVCINKIVDYRLAEDFEIIIGDLLDTGAQKRQGIATLNAIKSFYPYKVVKAMSRTPSLGKDLKVDGTVLDKSNKRRIKSCIKEAIEEAYTMLDNASVHWKSVETTLEKQHFSHKEIEKKKRDYYNFISRRQSV